MKMIKPRTRISTKVLVTLILLATSTLLVFAASSTFVMASAQGSTLVSGKVSTSPILDGDSSDSAWADATSITIATIGGSSGESVTLKAVHTDTDLYILAQWDDETMSLTRSGSWNWDGDTWSQPNGDQSEDRLSFLWNINMADFDTAGCMIKCHLQYGTAGAFLETEGETGDIWHMKAGRSLGVISGSQSGTLTIDSDTHEVTAGSVTLTGYSDDKVLTYEDENTIDETGDGGRHGDSGKSTYGNNRNEAKTGPLYIESNPANYIDAMILTQTEIDNGEAIELATASNADINTAWDIYESFNAIVPERIIREPEGSRGDVMQAATWNDGTWTSEFKRALVTGNDDDVQFSDLDASYSFSIALMDNSGGGADHSTAMMPYALEFAEEVTVSELEINFGFVFIFVALGAILTVAASRRRRMN